MPKLQTTSADNGENGQLWARWTAFWAKGVSHGARRRADAPAGERAHERGHVRSAGHVCGAAEWAFLQEKPPQGKQKPRSECFGDLLVAPTGVDPVTFRFSVERSTN